MIYAIVWAKKDSGKLNIILPGIKGISGEGLTTVAFEEITAIVTDIDKGNIVADSSGALAFARVINELWQQFTLLPMRFGSAMDSTEAIVKMLERNYSEIQQNLQKVENKIEFGLKVFCDSEKLKAKLLEKTVPEAVSMVHPDAETKISVFREYVNRKLEAHRLEELVLSHVDALIALITDQLYLMNADCKFRKMVTEKTIIDGTFLLDKEKKKEVIWAVEHLQNLYPELNFILTGPWPPYNFVDFKVK